MRYFLSLLFFTFISAFFTLSVAAAQSEIIYSAITPTPAIEYVLPYAGLLPDHPLYPLKALRDRILLFFASSGERKVQLNLLFADKRLVMGQLLWEKGNSELAISTLGKAEKYLLSSSLGLLPLKKENNLPPGLSDKVELAAKKHEEVISKLIASTSDENKKQGLSQTLGINHQATQQISLVK